RLRRDRLRPGKLRGAEVGDTRHSGGLPCDFPPHDRGARRSAAAPRLILPRPLRSRKMTRTGEGGDDMTIEVGDMAPEFSLPADGGRTVSLKALRGKKVILYFYPKDDTPGCTTEACAFRDAKPDFSSAGAEIFG